MISNLKKLDKALDFQGVTESLNLYFCLYGVFS